MDGRARAPSRRRISSGGINKMSNRISLIGCALAVSFAVACKQEPATDKTAAPAAPAAAPQATTRPAEATPTGAEAGHRKMANCPSSVAGANTAVSEAGDAVLVTITAKEAAAVTEIRERTKHLVEVAPKNPAEIKHTGEGEGGGGLGSCPVVLADTSLASEETEGGVKITMKPSRAEDLPKLAATAKERQAKLATQPK
jgi:hypothetical protein